MKRQIIQFSPRVTIESGPARKRGIATKELLDDKATAHHYQLGEYDAEGRRIVLGKEMAYLDFYGKEVWWIYQLRRVGFNKKGEILYPKGMKLLVYPPAPEDGEAIRTEERFLPVGVEQTEESALAFAKALKE